jgi:hypothetical protein
MLWQHNKPILTGLFVGNGSSLIRVRNIEPDGVTHSRQFMSIIGSFTVLMMLVKTEHDINGVEVAWDLDQVRYIM